MSRKALISFVAVIVFITALLGCSKSESKQDATTQNAEPLKAADVPLDGQPVSLAGVTFTPPGDWRDLGSSGMRKADYTFGPTGGDTDSATMAVYYFGPESGGGVEANIARWVGQMSMPDGSDPAKSATRKDYTVDGMAAHVVELNGTYNVSAGGPMMGGAITPKEGYLMSAVVLEGPQGNVFFKLTGPEATAKEMNKGFMAMLAHVKSTGAAM